MHPLINPVYALRLRNILQLGFLKKSVGLPYKHPMQYPALSDSSELPAVDNMDIISAKTWHTKMDRMSHR